MSIVPACELPPQSPGISAIESAGGEPGTGAMGGTSGAGGTDAVQPGAVSPGTPRRLRRLSNREYNNAVHDLIGDATGPAKGFLADAFATGYDNGPDDLIVQADQVASFQLAAESLAQTALTQHPELLIGNCDPATAGNEACASAFFRTFVPRAFRRPITQTESDRLRAVYDAGAADGGFWQGIELALETVLQSPQFLYREELGRAAGPGRVQLTPYELATQLAFMTTGSIPDDTLWSAVQAGHFETVGDYQREGTRLLATSAARANLRAFFHAWLATNRLIPTMTVKNPGVYPGWSRALMASMAGELDRLYEDAAFGDTGSLRALFSTPDGFVDPALAGLYGVTGPDSGFAPVTLDAAIRPGILSRAGYLAAHADSDSSGPVARGVFAMSALLCYPPLPRPATVPPPPSVQDANKAGQTTRQRFSQHSSDPRCSPCHRVIDGIGFGFEAFDGMGAYRTTEQGNPVDATGTLTGTGDANVDGPFDGVPGLVDRLLAGHALSDCFARQMFRFAIGSVEATADKPVVDALTGGFSVDARMTDVLMALLATPAFSERATLEAAP